MHDYNRDNIKITIKGRFFYYNRSYVGFYYSYSTMCRIRLVYAVKHRLNFATFVVSNYTLSVNATLRI